MRHTEWLRETARKFKRNEAEARFKEKLRKIAKAKIPADPKAK
jgi:hypothetical protein